MSLFPSRIEFTVQVKAPLRQSPSQAPAASTFAEATVDFVGGQPSQKHKASADTPNGLPTEALAKVGGGGGNRTRVRRSYTKGVYMLIPVFVLDF